MSQLISILISICLIFAPFQVLLPIPISYSNALNRQKQSTLESLKHELPTGYVPETVSDNNEYNVDNYFTVNIGSYCTYNIPLSHLTPYNSLDETSIKNYTYKGNKTRLTLSYASELSAETDVAGYVCNGLLKLDTTTNSKTPETYNNVTWYKVTSDTTEEMNKVYVWYTLNNSGTSVAYIKSSVHPDDDNTEFNYMMGKILESYTLVIKNGSVFSTPDSGIYQGSQADQGVYQQASKYNTIFGNRGGYVAGANISDDWRDLEIILDDVKFKLPCTMQDFYDAGYKLNDRVITEDKMEISAGRAQDVEIINENGTVAKVTAYNDSNNVKKLVNDIPIVKIKVDASQMVAFANKDSETTEVEESDSTEVTEITEDNTEESTEVTESTEESTESTATDEELTFEKIYEDGEMDQSEINQLAQNAADVINSSPDLSGIHDYEEAEKKKGKLSASEYNEQKQKQYESEKIAIASGKVSENFVSQFSESEKDYYENSGPGKSKISSEGEQDTVDRHIMIIAGGITWSVYSDDLINFYGRDCEQTSGGRDILKCKWSTTDSYMIIEVGKINGIKTVEISSMTKV